IKSMTLKAISEDSRNDVIATSAVLIATLVEHGMGYQIDGFMGVVVSLFVLYSGISLARETVSPLLGEGVNAELRGQLTEYIRSCPLVIGCHDLMVHDYGPGQCFASIHVEMDKNVDALVSHETIDQMERYCLKEFDTHLVIHYDPVAIDDREAEALKEQVLSCVQKIDSQIDLHDFRVSECDEEKRLAFDLVLPGKLGRQKDQIREKIEVEVNAESEHQYIIDVTFDVEER
ncbi:MAG: cation diffusion facilitator family transporter, partial [Eubacterium sp.]